MKKTKLLQLQILKESLYKKLEKVELEINLIKENNNEQITTV